MRSFVMVTALIVLSAPLALAGCLASPDDGNTDEAQQADKGFYGQINPPTGIPSNQLPPTNIGQQPGNLPVGPGNLPVGPGNLPVGPGNLPTGPQPGMGPLPGGQAPIGPFPQPPSNVIPPQAGMTCSPVESQPPQYPAPSFNAPEYPAPTFGAPSYTPPVFMAPTYRSPYYQAPSQPNEYAAPAYNAPSYAGPTFRAPVYEAPTYEAPTFLAPIYLPPNYEQPHELIPPNQPITCGCACGGNVQPPVGTMPVGVQGGEQPGGLPGASK